MFKIIEFLIVGILLVSCSTNSLADTTQGKTVILMEQEVLPHEKTRGSGELIYINYNFPTLFETGDNLKIYVGNKLASVFIPQGKFSLRGLSTRVKMKSTGVVKSVFFKKKSSKTVILEDKIVISRGFKVPTICDSKAQYKVRNKGNDHKILFKHHMSDSCFISNIEFRGKKGKMVVKMTNLFTRNPYFSFSGTNESSKLSIYSKVTVEK